MRINEERLNELSIMERIEYRQIKEDIDKTYSNGNTIRFFYIFLIALGFGLIFFPVYGLYGHIDISTSFSKYLSNLKIVFFISIPIGFLLDLFLLIMKKIKKEKLDEKYFEIKRKPTKK